ncbi:MAG TPA: VTT domain-containing protein [Stellaceae bacterium]|nr:VTT domain-containing protein [Stellaceae bacterium]
MKAAAIVARLLVLVLLAAGVAAAWRWRHLFEPLQLTATIARNPLAPLAFIVLQIAASLFFVPRTVLAVAAGLLFGIGWGVLWAALGSLVGAVAGFLVSRYLRAGLAARGDPRRLAALFKYAERGGWRMVAVLRLVPIIPHSLTNYALGLTRIRLGAYMLGSLLGQLPLTVAFVALGAAGGHALTGAANWPDEVLWPSLIGLAALGLSLLFPLLLRRRQPARGA